MPVDSIRRQATGLAHPRAYGNYPRILGKYVRDEKVIPLEDAVRKMTSAVATPPLDSRPRPARARDSPPTSSSSIRLTIADRATFEHPHQLSTGVRHVLVNGVLVVKDGVHTGALPGRALRGPGWNAR